MHLHLVSKQQASKVRLEVYLTLTDVPDFTEPLKESRLYKNDTASGSWAFFPWMPWILQQRMAVKTVLKPLSKPCKVKAVPDMRTQKRTHIAR